MTKSTLLLVLLVTLMCNTIFIHGRFMYGYDTEVREFKRSGCQVGCWESFESCLNTDGTFSGHLICLETKDNCLTGC